jgi:hypothetical protein
MNIKWLGRKSHLEINNSQVEVRGLSAGGREARVFRARNRVTCDLRRAIRTGPGLPPSVQKIGSERGVLNRQ